MWCWCSRGRQWSCPFAQLLPLHTLPSTEAQCQCHQPPLHACTCHNASTVLHHQSHAAVLPPCTTTIPTCHGHSLLVFRIAHTPYHTFTHTLTDSSHPSHPPLSTTTMHTFCHLCTPITPLLQTTHLSQVGPLQPACSPSLPARTHCCCLRHWPLWCWQSPP